MKKRNELGQFMSQKFIFKECLLCEKKFKVPDWNKNRKFCSQQCYWKFASINPYPNSFKKGHSLSGNQFKKGHKVPLEWKENLKKCYKGKHHSPNTEFKKGIHNNVREKNPMWKGGIMFEPYPIEFNFDLKEQIRKLDNHICKKCGKTQKEELNNLGKRLCVHHIDYNKKNCEINNLITLCNNCNTKVNINREYWTTYFQAIQSLRNLVNQVYIDKNI